MGWCSDNQDKILWGSTIIFSIIAMIGIILLVAPHFGEPVPGAVVADKVPTFLAVMGAGGLVVKSGVVAITNPNSTKPVSKTLTWTMAISGGLLFIAAMLAIFGLPATPDTTTGCTPKVMPLVLSIGTVLGVGYFCASEQWSSLKFWKGLGSSASSSPSSSEASGSYDSPAGSYDPPPPMGSYEPYDDDSIPISDSTNRRRLITDIDSVSFAAVTCIVVLIVASLLMYKMYMILRTDPQEENIRRVSFVNKKAPTFPIGHRNDL